MGSTFTEHGGVGNITMGEDRDDVSIRAPLLTLFEVRGKRWAFYQMLESVGGVVIKRKEK